MQQAVQVHQDDNWSCTFKVHCHANTDQLFTYETPCVSCQPQEDAHEESQKYKVGRFILERAHVIEASPTAQPPPPQSRLDSSVPPLSYFDGHSSDMDDHYF
jgi:hypothetical protein